MNTALVPQRLLPISVVLVLGATAPAVAQSPSDRNVFGSLANRHPGYGAMLHLAAERPLYEQMATLAAGRREDRFGFGGDVVQQGSRGFVVGVPRPGVWWLVARGSGPDFTSPDIAFPLVGPVSDVLLPPIHPTRGAACLLRLEPAVAWVAPGRRARIVEGGAGAFPRWGPWRPWIRLDRGAADREYWLDPAADPVSSPQPLEVTVGAPGHEVSTFECRWGTLIEVSLKARSEPPLELLLVTRGLTGDGGVSDEALQAAILVDRSGWPVGVADDAGWVAVSPGDYRVLGSSGDEWWIQVEGDGTRRLVVPDRSVEVLGPAEALPATVFALHWSRTGDLLGRQQLETTTATSGNSDRPKWTVRPPAGAVETIILASGFEMVTIDWSLGRKSVELTQLRSIEGVVVADDTGEPLQGAEVALHGAYTGRLAPVALTAANGVFRVDSGEAEGSPRLIVRAHGYKTARVDLAWLAPTGTAGAIVVRLERAAALVGRIVSSDGTGLTGSVALVSGQGPFPAPSVGPVDLFMASNPALHDVERADAAGVFRFPEVSSAIRFVAVGASGYATRLLPLRSEEMDATPSPEGKISFDLGDVVLVPEMVVEGVVTEESGLALSGATVGFARSLDVMGAHGLTGVSLPTGQVRADVEGRFQIGGLAEGTLVDLKVEHPGHALVELPRVAVSAATSPVWLSVEMKEASEVVGRVVDAATGAGLEGVRLELFDDSRRRQLAFERSGPEGRFVLRGIASLDGVLEVEAFGYESVRYRLADEIARRSTPGDGFVLTLRRGRASVRGVVLSGGAPVVGAAVRMNVKESAITDGAGRFELSGLPAGESMVFCWPSGDESGQPIMWSRHVRPGANEFVFDLTPVEVSGRVEDASGLPVAAATVRISRPLASAEEARSTSDGSFRVHVTPGRYEATVAADGYAGSSRTIDVAATEPVHAVFRLAPAREIRVRVVGLTAEETATVEVRMEAATLSPGGGGRLTRLAGPLDGGLVFLARNPPDGAVVLVVHARSSGRVQRRTVEVLPRGSTEIEIAFDDPEAKCRLSGLVTVDGSPLAGAPVFLIDQRAGDAWAVRTDNRGMYDVRGLRCGRVEIAAVGERRMMRVEGARRADFQARGAVLRGRVELADSGVPAAGIEVVATPAHVPLEIAESLAQAVVARSGEDGGFRFGSLYQVPYLVVARRHGGPALGSATVDLATAFSEVRVIVRDDRDRDPE